MSTEAIGTYSRDTVYGHLTYPFLNGGVKINAHTPYDKVDNTQSKAVSMKDFVNTKRTKLAVDMDSINNYEENLSSSLKLDFLEKDSEKTQEFPPTTVSSFSASSLSSKDIVGNALKNGYSTSQAVTISNANKAYKTSVVISKTPIEALSTRSYRVK